MLRARLYGFLLCLSLAHSAWAQPSDADKALIHLAADYLQRVLGDVSASTQALAREYERVQAARAGVASSESKLPQRRRNNVLQLQTWSAGQPEPGYQNASPSFFVYGEGELSIAQKNDLEILQQLVPVLRAVHDTFEFSWTYITSAQDVMVLYPFLTLAEALANDRPSAQIFYTSADFARRRPGWTAPYLDLAGAGMMVTVSVPAYSGDRLLGVASHDITLHQLSHAVLQHLSGEEGRVAYLTDASGLVLAVTAGQLAEEQEKRNAEAGRAVVRYRAQVGEGEANSRIAPWINALTESLLQAAPDAKGISRAQTDGHNAIALRLKEPDWVLVLVDPSGR